MILFKRDWLKFPSATPHWETNNKSFYRYCALLKRMGVQNCLFPLALHDPTLAKVNPYEDNLPKEIVDRIIVECYTNPWYFAREIWRRPGQSGGQPSLITANRSVICL